MANSSQLARLMAELTQETPEKIAGRMRHLRQAGLVSVGRRGVLSRMTDLDAALLYCGICGSHLVKDTVTALGNLDAAPGRRSRIAQSSSVKKLLTREKDLLASPVRAFAALLDFYRTRGGADDPKAEFEIERPGTYASLRVEFNDGGMAAWNYGERNEGQFVRNATCTGGTIRKVAEFLAADQPVVSDGHLRSRALADVVADAIGIERPTSQLHLKTIRAAGKITFGGYGRSAASMTPLDAARMLIAIAGSVFAKDSVRVLERFAGLTAGRRGQAFEERLAKEIAELASTTSPPPAGDRGIELAWVPDRDDLAFARSWLSTEDPAFEPVWYGSKSSAADDVSAVLLTAGRMFQTRTVAAAAIFEIAKAL